MELNAVYKKVKEHSITCKMSLTVFGLSKPELENKKVRKTFFFLNQGDVPYRKTKVALSSIILSILQSGGIMCFF